MTPASYFRKTRKQFYRYVPPDIPRGAIRRFARRIADQFNVERIVLFGSFAHGAPHAWSDVDLLVVMTAHNELNQAIRIKLAMGREFPLDLIVRTPDRFLRQLRRGDSFLSEIMGKGIVLYEKRGSKVAEKSGLPIPRIHDSEGLLDCMTARQICLWPTQRAPWRATSCALSMKHFSRAAWPAEWRS